MSSNIDHGPTAPLNNPPIHPEYFEPKVFFISAITLGMTTLVTTSVPNDYVIGQEVRLNIGEFYGARGLNQQTGFVISIPAPNQVELDIYSASMNQFIPSPPFGPNRPQIVAIGDVNSGIISQSGRVLTTTAVPGAFQNISPL